MQYERLASVTRADADRLLKCSDVEQLAKTLVALAEMTDVDYIEEKYLDFLEHPNDICAGAAIVGLSHLARIHRAMNFEKVSCRLEELAKTRPALRGRIRDTLDDMEIYL